MNPPRPPVARGAAVPVSVQIAAGVRWLVLGAAAAACLIAYAPELGWRSGPDVTAIAHHCPMHPQVVGRSGSSCPICQMNLEPIPAGVEGSVAADGTALGTSSGSSEIEGLSEIDLDRGRRQKAGLLTRLVERRSVVADVSLPAVLVSRGIDAPVTRGAVGSTAVEVWARFPRDLARHLAPGTEVGFVPSSFPDRVVRGVVLPEEGGRAGRWTSPLRVHIAGARGARGAGLAGTIELGSLSIDLLLVPETAVFHGRTASYCYVTKDGRHFVPQKIEVGRRVGGEVAVSSGLHAGDEILFGQTFYADAESRLTAGFKAAKRSGARP